MNREVSSDDGAVAQLTDSADATSPVMTPGMAWTILRRSRWRAPLSQPRWLLMAWAALLALSVLTIVLYAAGTPVYFAQISTVCNACHDERLTTTGMAALRQLGVPVAVYAAYWTAINLVFALAYCLMAAFLLWRKPTDRVTLLAAFAFLAMGGFFPNIPSALATAHPVWRLPVTLLDDMGFPAFIGFLFVFPTGSFAPRYTRWVVGGFAVISLASGFLPGSAQSLIPSFHVVSLLIIMVVFGLLVYAQVYRFRRVSSPIERQQTKWVVFGVALALAGFVLVSYAPLAALSVLHSAQPLPLLATDALVTGVYLFLLIIPLTIALAIQRYHLWDIDRLINRTVVYGVLTVGVVGGYSLVVLACDMVLRTRANFLISLLATGLIALLFQPLRQLLQRSVNRLLYGQRDEPYTVIARLSQRLKETLAPEATLATITETVAQSLKLSYVAIRQRADDSFELAASYGKPTDETVILPLVYQTEIVGQLVLAQRSPGEPFSPADMRLLDELARQVGLATHAIRLTTALQQARERLVMAREEERRRLRRDLHDGVGPTLASLAQRIDTAAHLIPSDPDAAVALLGASKGQLKGAIGDIRRVVYSLRPPVLDELGLVSALHEYVVQPQATSGLLVSVEAQGDLPPLPAAVEVAAYRIAVEAITNVARHANARRCAVSLRAPDGRALCLTISDDGCGLPVDYHAGVGVTAIRERVAELGGVCDILAHGPHGVCVSVRLPLGDTAHRSALNDTQ